MSKASPFFHTQISQISLGEGDQGQTHIPFLFQGTSSSSRTPCPLLLETQKAHTPHDGKVFNPENKDGNRQEQVKWMSSKMRIMKKMMSSDQSTASKPRRSNSQQQEKNGSKILPCGVVRVCSDCNTTKTPLWRSGPQGPKSLCNACGIRQRKARRSMSALHSATNCRAARDDRTVPFKKRCRFISTGVSAQRKLCSEDVAASLKRARVFPQDEKDAAILLMALSCGLICS